MASELRHLRPGDTVAVRVEGKDDAQIDFYGELQLRIDGPDLLGWELWAIHRPGRLQHENAWVHPLDRFLTLSDGFAVMVRGRIPALAISKEGSHDPAA